MSSHDLDRLTFELGIGHNDHYRALLARNACHFAPYSWYRWQARYLIARDLATQAHFTAPGSERDRLIHQAWIHHGYADHFLQDSFASGHLINKTLIMQWFVEWVGDTKTHRHVPDWDLVQHVTTQNQPQIWGPSLYAGTPVVADPETAEEESTQEERMRATGVQAYRDVGQVQAYQQYLAFLNASVVQCAAALLHDHFNADSLWVSSIDHHLPFQVYGDNSMLEGGDGAVIASETAHMSQQSILELIGAGSTPIGMETLRNRFPTMVSVGGQSEPVPLETWHLAGGLKELCHEIIFPHVHSLDFMFMPTLNYVSQDMKQG